MDVVLANFPKLVAVAVKKAQEGDAKFAKMLLDRIWPVTDGDPSKQKGSVQVKITVNGIPNEKIIDGDLLWLSLWRLEVAKKMTKSKKMIEEAFHEVFMNEPEVVAKTRARKGAAAAKKQKVAIALSKARKRGAKVPRRGK